MPPLPLVHPPSKGGTTGISEDGAPHGYRHSACWATHNFECAVYHIGRTAGTPSVGFKNYNLGSNAEGKAMWDRTCCTCADSHVVPRHSAAPSTPSTHPSTTQTTSSTASTVGAFEDDAEEEEERAVAARLPEMFYNTSDAFGWTRAAAHELINEFGGDVIAANAELLKRVGISEDDFDTVPAPTARRDRAADVVGDPPALPMPSLSSDEARAAASYIFCEHVTAILPLSMHGSAKVVHDQRVIRADHGRLFVSLLIRGSWSALV